MIHHRLCIRAHDTLRAASPRNHTNRSEEPLPRRKTRKRTQRRERNSMDTEGGADKRTTGRWRERRKTRRTTADGGRSNSPQAVFPVHGHIHLVHAALRHGPRRNQQTHTCREDERSRMDGGIVGFINFTTHNWIIECATRHHFITVINYWAVIFLKATHVKVS